MDFHFFRAKKNQWKLGWCNAISQSEYDEFEERP